VVVAAQPGCSDGTAAARCAQTTMPAGCLQAATLASVVVGRQHCGSMPPRYRHPVAVAVVDRALRAEARPVGCRSFLLLASSRAATAGHVCVCGREGGGGKG